MNTWKCILLTAACALMAGCSSTRSISNSGYHESNTASFRARDGCSDPAFVYRGELSEFDVLGVARSLYASEEDIQEALRKAKAIRLTHDSAVLLVQSGAVFPDGPMVAELSKHFKVVPFSGVPPRSNYTSDNDESLGLSQSLLLAAARAGAETILCCWGVVESAQEKFLTKTVSWVPVVGWVVPDEREHMRIRLKVALIDVRTGNWSVLSPPPFDSKALSVGPRRAVADQKLVERLKQRAYAASVRELVRVYADGEVSANDTN